MLIIDGNNLLHRIVEGRGGVGIHPVREVYNRFSIPTATPIIIVWDGPHGNRERRKIYPEYKANRKPKEESKLQFFDMAKVALGFTNVIQVQVEGHEADDVIGTLVNKYYKSHDITLESNDGDYWQHSDKCSLPLVSKSWAEFSPDESTLYKSLVGDRKDNIPGLKGFGETSWKLLPAANRQKLIGAMKLDDYELFHAGAQAFPKRVKANTETFLELTLWWKSNKWMEVPENVIEEFTTVGQSKPQYAESYLGEWMI